MMISVVVPAKNEEKLIGRCLEALRDQTRKPYEIIIVDGHSADRTRKIARKYGRVVLDRGRGISDARNQGAALAKGDVVAYTDADSMPPRDWLKNIGERMGGNAAISGPIRPIGGGLRPKLTLKLWTELLFRLTGAMGYPCFCGPNMAFRRDKLLKYKFRAGLIEDFEIGNRMKDREPVRYDPGIVMYVSPRRYGAGFHRMAFRSYILNYIRIKLGLPVKAGSYWK